MYTKSPSQSQEKATQLGACHLQRCRLHCFPFSCSTQHGHELTHTIAQVRQTDITTSRLWSHLFYKQGNNGQNESSSSDMMNQTLNDSEKLQVPGLRTVLEFIRLRQLCVRGVNDLQTIASVAELLKKFALGFPVTDTHWQSPRTALQCFVLSIDGYVNHHLH